MQKRAGKPSVAYLIHNKPEGGSACYPLHSLETTIGRHPANQVRIRSDSVSRFHAKIRNRGGAFILSDLGSSNGSYVNSQRVTESRLSEGDQVTLGSETFLFTLNKPGEGPERSKPAIVTRTSIRVYEGGEIQPSEMYARSADDATDTFFQSTRALGDRGGGRALLTHTRLSLLYKLSETLRTAREVDVILEKGMDLLFNALSADSGVALLRSSSHAPLVPRVVKQREDLQDCEIAVSQTVLDRVIKERMAVLCYDARGDARFKDSESLRLREVRSILCVPLLHGDRAIGALHLDSRTSSHSFDRGDLDFVAAIANEMAVSIENLRLQEQAVQDEKMVAIGLTIANVAHNIKNILQLNQGAMELMDSSVAHLSNERIRKSWHLVHLCLERIGSFSSDMLSFARNRETNLQPVDINESIKKDLENLENSLSQKGVALRLNLGAGVPILTMDEAAFARCLFNLVVNASDAIGGADGGEIAISTGKSADGFVRVAVKDNGQGLSDEARKNLFTPFFTTKGANGTGLGLATVRRFVESLGGTIEVESEAGRGSTFTMVFPIPNKEEVTRVVPSQG